MDSFLRWSFTAIKISLIWRFKNYLFSPWNFDNMTWRKKMFWSNTNQMDQPIMATGAWSSRRLNKCDWMAISHPMNIYIAHDINIKLYSICFSLSMWQGEKNYSNFFSRCESDKEGKKCALFFLLGSCHFDKKKIEAKK